MPGVRPGPPSPWTSLRTRPLDLFIHQTHLLETDWAGLCLFSSRAGTWACDYKGQKRGDPGEAGGEGALSHPGSAASLAGPPSRGEGPAPGVRAGVKRPGHGRHPRAPLTVRQEVRSPAQFAAAALRATSSPKLQARPSEEVRLTGATGNSPSRSQSSPASRVVDLFLVPK